MDCIVRILSIGLICLTLAGCGLNATLTQDNLSSTTEIFGSNLSKGIYIIDEGDVSIETYTSNFQLAQQALVQKSGTIPDMISVSCTFDRDVDKAVPKGQPCSNLKNFYFSSSTGVVQWKVEASDIGPYEVQLRATKGDDVDYTIFTVDISAEPAFSILNDTAYAFGDQTPDILVPGDFPVGSLIQIFADPQCNQYVAELKVTDSEKGFQTIPSPVEPGNHKLYLKVKKGDAIFPCSSRAVDHKYSAPVRTVDIVATVKGFAALKEDGSVTFWGESADYADGFEEELQSGFVEIVSNDYTYALRKNDGSVLVLGNTTFAGNVTEAGIGLSSGVVKVIPSHTAMAALKDDGSVVSWGHPSAGVSPVAPQVASGVVSVIPSRGGAFAALKSNSSVVTWGYSASGGDSSAVSGLISSGVVSVFSNNDAFAALKSDGSVVTWGSASAGGNSSSVAVALSSGVVSLAGTKDFFSSAFAAIKSDGSVVTWGDGSSGANQGSAASNLTSGVVKVIGNSDAFAAIKSDGSVVTWGNSSDGGNSSAVSADLSSGVVEVYANPGTYGSSFAALKQDGSVVTWGYAANGGDSSSVALKLSSGVVQVTPGIRGYAALKDDGSVVSWGSLGDVPDDVQVKIKGKVVKLALTMSACSALLVDGSVVTWGGNSVGGIMGPGASQSLLSTMKNPEAIQPGGFFAISQAGKLTWAGNQSQIINGYLAPVSALIASGVESIKQLTFGLGYAAMKNNQTVVALGQYTPASGPEITDINTLYFNDSSFAALKNDGSVITWGYAPNGGDSSSVSSLINSNVVSIASASKNLTGGAFAALKNDGSVVAWGSSAYGGDTSSASPQLTSGVVKLLSGGSAFVALKDDESVVAWGSTYAGGDTTTVAAQLSSGVKNLVNNINSTTFSHPVSAWAARKSDGSVVTWGRADMGGDSSTVSSQISSGVEKVVVNGFSFAALKNDASVVTWGGSWGADSTSVAAHLSSGVTTIIPNPSGSFAALKDDLSVVVWGRGGTGSILSGTSPIEKTISGGDGAFAFLRNDGSVSAWGPAKAGGDLSGVAQELSSGVVSVYSNGSAFAALKDDGSAVVWGDKLRGGGYYSAKGLLAGGILEIRPLSFGFLIRKLGGHSLILGGNGSSFQPDLRGRP